MGTFRRVIDPSHPVGYRWKELPNGYVVAERVTHPPGSVEVQAFGSYDQMRKDYWRRIKSEVRQGHIRTACRLVEELRQASKRRRQARRALREAQAELFPRR